MSLPHLVFPTYELHPVNPGGAGVLVAGAVRALAKAGFRCTVVCDFPDGEIAAAQQQWVKEGFEPNVLRAVSVRELVDLVPPRPEHFFYDKSAMWARAMKALHARDPIDVIEFPEYAGMGYVTLVERLRGSPLDGVTIAVRIHGSLEFIDQVERLQTVESARHRMYRMERTGMRLADVLLTPSDSLGEFYRQAHGLEADALVLSRRR